MKTFRKKTLLKAPKEIIEECLNNPHKEKRLYTPNLWVTAKKGSLIARWGPFSKAFPWVLQEGIKKAKEGHLFYSHASYKPPLLYKKAFSHQIRELIRYRHKVIKADTEQLALYPQKQRLSVLLTGSSGTLGQTLYPFLCLAGCQVHNLVRNVEQSGPDHMPWDPEKGMILQQKLEGYDAVIHLSGHPLSTNLAKVLERKKIWNSHVESTKFLVDTLQRLSHPPELFVASSTAYYGSCKEGKTLNEDSPSGSDFLAQLFAATEKAANAYTKGRVVHLRFAPILSPFGGTVQHFIQLAKKGLLPSFGSGKQMVDWVCADDAAYAIWHLLQNRNIFGPVNICSPNALSNKEWTKQLLSHFSRTPKLPLPEFLTRFFYGAWGQQVLLANRAVIPTVLQENDFSWRYPLIGSALNLHCK